MARLFAILVCAWSLLLGPALCMGGLLEHDCPCENEAQCEHEDNCTEDPCETLARPDRPEFAECMDLQLQAVPVEQPDDVPFRYQRNSWRVPAPPDWSPWLYHTQNRPLLI